MLNSTFQHIRGISPNKELAFWKSGITSWEMLEQTQARQYSLFGDDQLDLCTSPLQLSVKAFNEGNVDFFAENLSKREHYRIAATFPEHTLFLDIETTGLSKHYDKITIVGWSLGQEFGVYIQGSSDDKFRKAVSEAKAIVTFNGSLFDLPFIKKEFDYLKLPSCHVDLRFLAKRVGLSGGQKTIENEIGLKRSAKILNMTGEVAPVLWYKYRWGDMSALKQLIQYNHADIEGMKAIFDAVLDRLLKNNQIPKQISRSVPRFSKLKTKIKWADSPETGGIHLQPYAGVAGPLIMLKDLNVVTKNSYFKVVGIDLTGSEKKPSGWCLLTNDVAETRCLGTDRDIIETTLRCNPQVVSIDSPLSMPTGRITVTDDDPGRNIYGIMRVCERVLKRRGVNVYPSLLPSMQKLTARGIKLANEFRSLGIPVIESYPGAAQDIIGIPRKQASLEYLERGLQLFGIKGNFDFRTVTHDELDAITSAIVGQFFWSGKFEALGNDAEEYLIIPDLHVDTKPWRKRTVIGLSGPIATGKTTAGKSLEPMGFVYGRYSQVLKQILENRGIEANRITLQEIGDEINKAPGQRWLCKELIKFLPEKGNLVIDGLRHPEDHAFLVETFGPSFIHVHIDTPEMIRAQRYSTDGHSDEEFIVACNHHVEMEISKLSTLAHVRICNDSDIPCLKAAMADIAKCTTKVR